MIKKRKIEHNPLEEANRIIKEAEKKKESKEMSRLEKEVLKRLRKKRRKKKVTEEKTRKPKFYVKLANKLFSKISLSLYKTSMFNSLRKDLIRANLSYLPVSYISMAFLLSLLSGILACFIVLFLMFFKVTIHLPFIVPYTGDMFQRFMNLCWIIFIAPIATFLIVYFYPSMEKNYIKDKINQELPFVAIHLSAIANSMVEPSKMFEIIIATNEYPYTSKEFRKIINEINVYGYNLVGALRKSALNTSSYKLAELLNGIATTITSGGDLKKYFEKKAQGLLFEYRLEREKYTRMAETFMDIYISVVIAAPMILMLLLMMIQISGLWTGLSGQMLTFMIVGGVTIVNVLFLTFIYLKQPES